MTMIYIKQMCLLDGVEDKYILVRPTKDTNVVCSYGTVFSWGGGNIPNGVYEAVGYMYDVEDKVINGNTTYIDAASYNASDFNGVIDDMFALKLIVNTDNSDAWGRLYKEMEL